MRLSSVGAVGCRVVAISATDGSAGDQLGPIVARELGFRLVNEQIIVQAAREAGVTPEAIADVERRKSVLARVLDSLAERPFPAMAAGMSGHGGTTGDLGPSPDLLRGLIRSAVWESAERGNAVIVAHAASLALANRTDVLRVCVTASPETRAQRLAEAEDIGEAEAKKLVASRDANRADYLKRFYGASAELPTHYDIVLNTDRVAPEDAAALILRVARSQIPA
jgi:cytidylate kinase